MVNSAVLDELNRLADLTQRVRWRWQTFGHGCDFWGRWSSPLTGLVVAIVGPTATGKSDLALALAQSLDGEIISADAMQLYQGMSVGTAKIPLELRRGIVHHQLDVLQVRQEAAVAAYQRSARADIEAVWARGRVAILAGGSGLYVRAVLDRIEFPGTDPQIRSAWQARADAAPPGALHAELAACDPAAAARIEPANTRRLVRALEVIELTGRPFSASLPPGDYWCPAVQIGLDLPDDVLDRRIAARVDQMLADGLIDEVRALEAIGLREGRTAARAIGYAQGLAVLAGQLTIDQARDAIALATRQLARRQRKWFRRDHRITWLDPRQSNLIEVVLAIVADGPARTGSRVRLEG